MASLVPTVGSYNSLEQKLYQKDGLVMDQRIERLKDGGIKDLYINWVLRSYAENGIQSLDQLPEVFEYLSIFETLKMSQYLEIVTTENNFEFNEADINSYCGLSGCVMRYFKPGLKTWIDQHHSEHIKEIKRRLKSNRKIKESAKKVFESENISIINPQTEEASCLYGAGTKWCTAAEKKNMFYEYNKEGPLYIVIDKKTNEKYQLHFETQQYTDAENKEIPIRMLINKYPDLKLWIKNSLITSDNVQKMSYILDDVSLFQLKNKKDTLYLAAKYGSINILRSVDTILNVKDIKADLNLTLRTAVKYGNLEMLKYLKAGFGLTADDARAAKNDALRSAAKGGYLDILKYLREEFGLTTDDVRDEYNAVLLITVINDDLDMLKYLRTGFGITVDDIRSGEALGTAIEYGKLNIIKYLKEEFGLTSKDVIMADLYRSLYKSYWEVFKYVVEEFNITARDIQFNNNLMPNWVEKNGTTEMKTYFKDKFNL